MRIQNLRTHPYAYVSVGELARYWGLGRKTVYKLIATGQLPAVRFGPRLFRISTAEAIRFEAEARLERSSA